MGNSRVKSSTLSPAISVEGLHFQFKENPVFQGLDVQIPAYSRCLVLGCNGVGKSTLLRLVAGKHMIQKGRISVLGKDPFLGQLRPQHVGLVAGHFPLELDIRVQELLDSPDRAAVPKARVKQLLSLLEVEPTWRMHQVSTGQRRRVDLLLTLLEMPQLLLLDEATADLDLLGRQALLKWLKEQTSAKKMTVLLATHILDGMERWATHVAFLVPGTCYRMWPIRKVLAESKRKDLFEVSEKWMRRFGYGRERIPK